jgi:hypothetical protein
MAIFEADSPGFWQPSPLAAGPFSGLQGGAVAGLLTAEIEALAVERNWGIAISVTAMFLKPTPMKRLRSHIAPLREGGRVSVVDNTLFADTDAEPSATVRVTLIRERPIDGPDIPGRHSEVIDPTIYPVTKIPGFHGNPWMMDAMEVRNGEGIAWFHQHTPFIESAATGTLSSVLGPADWAHGIARPLKNVVADPNPNLTVHLLKAPKNGWIGIKSQTSWDMQRGIGIGGGRILDTHGDIGSVSMAVALTPFPKPAAPPA